MCHIYVYVDIYIYVRVDARCPEVCSCSPFSLPRTLIPSKRFRLPRVVVVVVVVVVAVVVVFSA